MIIVIYFTAFISFNTALLLNDCQNTPFWKLNLCPIDCDKCATNAVCQSCPDGFNITQSQCEPDSDIIYNFTYFTTPQINSTLNDQNVFKASNQYLIQNDVVRICQANSYKFQMVGLFPQQTRVTYNMNFDTPVTQVTIKFNFLTLYNNTKLEVVLNGDQVYQVIFQNSGIDNTYEPTTDSINYLNIPSLQESSANVIINKVQTNPISFSTSLFNQNNQISLQITYTTNSTNTSSFWAFSDFSVVGKKCEDCIPQKLKTLSSNVAIAIGITSGALLILILIMYGCVKLEERRRLNFNQRSSNYATFNQNDQKQEEKQEQKENDLKIRQTLQRKQQIEKKTKKNKIS